VSVNIKLFSLVAVDRTFVCNAAFDKKLFVCFLWLSAIYSFILVFLVDGFQ